MATSLVAELHDSSLQLVLATTGGGSLAIGDLLAVPGASRTVLEAVVPYASAALDAFLAARPEHYCSEHTARLMAMAAYERAARWGRADGTACGVGATASLASDRPKRGPHRLHVAVQTDRATRTVSVELAKGARSRGGEERLAADLLLNVLAETAGLSERIAIEWLAGETPVRAAEEAPESWRELFAGRIACVASENAGSAAAPRVAGAANGGAGRVVFPGAFHPRHDGHRRMAALAERRLGRPTEHEISIQNVDKPRLDFLEMRRRAEQFGAGETLWWTRAPTFVEKSRIFPGATFVVGADTIVRIGEPRYYGGDAAARDRALESLAAAGCRFLVFGRVRAGRFETLDDLPLPPALRALCDGCDETEFRADVSSTELRRASGE